MKNKIVVLRLKDIIKKAVFFVIGLIIIFFVIGLFAGENEDTAYNPGTYKADIVLHGSPVELNVTLSDDSILDITLSQLSETQAVFYPTFDSCFQDISASVIEAQSTDIEIPQDYAVTGDILISAIDYAISQGEKISN